MKFADEPDCGQRPLLHPQRMRDRNARYLQDRSGITRNTAKSHIAHIYARLGVHSRQELIDLVEQAEKRAPEREGPDVLRATPGL